jgi:hypothetical protein
MTKEERVRLIAFLESKMCRPCLRDGPISEHPGCVEAAALVEIVRRDL